MGCSNCLASAMIDAESDMYQGLVQHPHELLALADAGGAAVIIDDQLQLFGH